MWWRQGRQIGRDGAGDALGNFRVMQAEPVVRMMRRIAMRFAVAHNGDVAVRDRLDQCRA